MKLLKYLPKFTCCLLMVISDFCLFSCNKENDITTDTPIEIYKQIPPVTTPMETSSIIALPDGVNEEYLVINSKEELCQNIPYTILTNNPDYQNADFNNSSLIIIKFRLFYELKESDYRINTRDFKTYKITQALSVDKTLLKEGFFVMSCVVTKKIQTNSTLSIEQSLTYL